MTLNYRQKQAGFVLAISMIFLIVMTMLAVTAIKKATMDEKVTGNLRSQNLAFEAAEKALRFCESTLNLAAGSPKICQSKPGSTVPIYMTTRPYQSEDVTANFPEAWANDDNWFERGPNNAVRLSGVNIIPNVVTQPQCMIERWSMPDSRSNAMEDFSPFVVTARGVGSVATAVVWLQEVIRCGNQ
jgi:type IV pilus assembly protein PilX